MDTPERNQIGTPLSKIEESPFSNFANSLSPIDASKPTHISQTFSSISFTSPPSVFTSPHVSLHKDSRFLRRHQVSDLAKPKLSSEEENRSFKAEQLLSADQQHQESTNDEVRSEKPSNNEASVDPLSDVSKVTTDSASEIDGRCELNMSGALVSYVKEPHVASFGAELNSHDMDQDNVEEPCDWQSLISGSTDLLVLDSPNDTAVLKESFQNSIPERNAFVSLLSRFPPSLENGPSDSNHVNSAMYNESSGIDQSAQSTEINVLEQMDQVPENRALVCMHDYASVEKLGNKSFYSVHRGLRRRCLDFEMPRAKIIDSVLHTSSSLSLFEAKSADSKHPITPRHDSSRCVLPSIGLHLNALAAASNDCRVPNQEMSTPRSEEALLNSTASVPSEKDAGLAENELQIVEDPLLAAMYAATAEVNSNSPKKKRSKTENNTEGESCKRCNCKKSKCLKLYCECFAAGVYCVEPCSCQDCFNKPIHEETVLATRKQIESRNPLAFAPKVIRTLDSTQEIGQEDSTRTPASARHKRGCNCKKSNCLKKYCECYQGGVGCSVSCRCEGCKNAFGRKEGMTLLGMEAEIEEHAPEKHIMDKDPDLPASASYLNDDKQNSELTLPKTPLRLLRTSVSHPTSSKGKPPRSSTAKMSSSSYLNPIDGAGRSTFLRCQTKVDKCRVSSGEELPTVLENTSPPPSSSIKTLSPNGKRVSTPHGNGTSPAMRSSRKLILQSIPSFPSLTPRD